VNKKALRKKELKEKQKKEEKSIKLWYSFLLEGKLKYLIYIPFIVVIAAGVYFVYSSHNVNGYFGFPLDDPWIHLTFAKNLVEYGSFSYFKDEIVTSGSTSPVYTLLLSLFYFIIKNEYILSYIIGILFGAMLVYMFVKLSGFHFKNGSIIALLAALLIALQPKLNLINVSGMETSMFIFFIAVSLYAYHTKKILLLGVFLGLTIWCRPDGFILWIAIAIDYFLLKYFFKTDSENYLNQKELIKAFAVAGIFIAGYFLFNFILSGSILPNTYSAKLEFYQNNDRALFLENEVLNYFTQYEFVVIWIPFLFGVLGILKSFIKKEYNSFLVYLLFIIGLIAVYYIKLPFSHRFGRYLIPVIPFYILIAISGIKIIIDFIHNRMVAKKNPLPNFLFLIYSASAVIVFINFNDYVLDEYNLFNKYHNERHVAAGKWIKENTNESDLIATHDIGAIAFYGERKIIDMAGLVTPELIDKINTPTYSSYINKYLAQENINYLITLRNWFEVVNDKPVYTPVNEFEFLEVFKYKPGQTHIQPKIVSNLNQAAIQMMQRGSSLTAINYLNQSLNYDAQSSMTYFLLGVAYESLKDYKKAEENLKKALEIFPGYFEAYFSLARINFEENNLGESQFYLDECLSLKPDYQPALELKERLASLPN